MVIGECVELEGHLYYICSHTVIEAHKTHFKKDDPFDRSPLHKLWIEHI